MSIRQIFSADIPALFRVRPQTRENALTVDELRALGITPESVALSLEGSTRGWLWETSTSEIVGFCMGPLHLTLWSFSKRGASLIPHRGREPVRSRGVAH